jgi:hypothetical protein
MTKWNDRLAFDFRYAKDMLAKNGEVISMFIVHCKSGDLKIVPAMWDNGEQKKIVQNSVAVMAVAEEAPAISFISEAWQRKLPKADDESEDQWLERADNLTDEQRETLPATEIVIVSCVYRENGERHVIAASAEIMRDDDGDVTGTVDLGGDDGPLDLTGPMVEILCPGEPTKRMVAEAKQIMATIEAAGMIISQEVSRHGVN